MGLVVNHQKSELTPSRQFLFLGYMFDMIKYQCTPPQKRMDKFLVIIQHILGGQGAVARQWQVLLGLPASSEKAVPLGRLHMREIMFCLYEQWDFNPTTSHRFIHWCPWARKNLCWWTLHSMCSEDVWSCLGNRRSIFLRMLLSRVGEHTGAPTTSRVSGLPRREKTT